MDADDIADKKELKYKNYIWIHILKLRYVEFH